MEAVQDAAKALHSVLVGLRLGSFFLLRAFWENGDEQDVFYMLAAWKDHGGIQIACCGLASTTMACSPSCENNFPKMTAKQAS